MFDNLIESQAAKQKRAGGFLWSFVIHSVLISGAVYATYSVGNALEKPKAEKAEFKAPEGTAFSGKAATTATFSAPGDYVLEVVANDISGVGGGGFQCCWTTAQVKVTVK